MEVSRRRKTTRVNRRLVGVNFSGLGDDPVAELELLIGAATPEELRRALRAEVEAEVREILNATASCDAFDVIELLRLREFPVAPVAGLAPDFDGSGAVVELVSLVLLARNSGRVGSSPRPASRPHELVPDLHRRAKRLLRLATFRDQVWAKLQGSTAVAQIAASYQSYFVGVRALRYESVEREHDRALFDRPELDRLLRKHLGFTYAEFERVRDTIQDRYSSTVTNLRDVIGDIALSARADTQAPSPDEIRVFQEALIDWMFLPAERASFTAAEIADHADLSEVTVSAVLSAFSLGFDNSRDPADVIMDFLQGRNPLWAKRLVRSGDAHVMTSDAVGSDSLRSVVESALSSDKKAWQRYDRTRATVSEALAVQAIEKLLRTAPTGVNFKYFAPAVGGTPEALASNCPDPRTSGKLVESDALFVVDDIALCVEVKGRAVAEAARRGDLTRLETEVANILGSAAGQARRLETLIRSNSGLWREDGSWLDLSEVREIRSVVVGLDYFGPLSIALGDLASTSLLGEGPLPWIASIHDLEVISRVIDRPAEFLLYIRRRSDSGVADHYRSMDELDLFMLFLEGGLYVEPDPDEVRRAHPQTPPASRQDRRQRQKFAIPTFVGTHTDPLDAWMYWVEGHSPYEVEKPTFLTHEWANEIVDFLSQQKAPGWFRFGADLLGLSGDAQATLARNVEGLVDLTRSDGRYHTMVNGFAGLWGYPSFFVGTTTAAALTESAKRFRTYMLAKKHQLQSDRSLGLLLDELGLVRAVVYLNDLPRQDPDLDTLVKELGLQPTSRRRSGMPPPLPATRRRKNVKKRRR